MSTAIKITDLSKKYMLTVQPGEGEAGPWFDPRNLLGRPRKKDFWALRDINLEIAQGDKVAIIGHNGAGKSTLFKILSRITAPTTGRVELYGRVASLLEVGTGFHRELTGRENIFLNGSVLGMSHSEVRRKFDEIVDFSGVEEFIDMPVKNYSSGMRMRLGFAVAAHLESEILIIDEVLAVGDAAFQKKCLGKMDQVSKAEGRTILFVSHNAHAARQLCNRGVVMNKGEIVRADDINKALAFYHDSIKVDAVGVRLWQENAPLVLEQVPVSLKLRPGEDLKFVLDFVVRHKISDVKVDFSIYNLNHKRLVHFRGEHVDVEAKKNGGSMQVQIVVPTLALNEGEYKLNLRISDREGRNLFHGDEISLVTMMAPSQGINRDSIWAPKVAVSVK